MIPWKPARNAASACSRRRKMRARAGGMSEARAAGATNWMRTLRFARLRPRCRKAMRNRRNAVAASRSWIRLSGNAVGLMVRAMPESNPKAAADQGEPLRTATKRKAVAVRRRTAMVRSRWPPSARPSRPWIRMKREAEKRPASQLGPNCGGAIEPTLCGEAAKDGPPNAEDGPPNAEDGPPTREAPLDAIAKKDAEAMARRVKSKRRQARSPVPK